MKSYPSIQYWNKGVFGDSAYVSVKLDGTQIRAEWSKKRKSISAALYKDKL